MSSALHVNAGKVTYIQTINTRKPLNIEVENS